MSKKDEAFEKRKAEKLAELESQAKKEKEKAGVPLRPEMQETINVDLKKLIKLKKFNRKNFFSKGDDYQILFTSSKSNRKYIKSLFKRMNQKVTLIGDLTNEIKSNQIIYNKNLIKHSYNEGYSHNF